MTEAEANMILSRHLMQCGMMMPLSWVQKNGEGSEFMQAYEMAMEALKNAPVRCKECAVPHNQWTGCPHLNGLVPPPDFFCAKGEKKDNGRPAV